MKWLLLVVCGLAALSDIMERRIPNFWLMAWFLTGMLLSGTAWLDFCSPEAFLCRIPSLGRITARAGSEAGILCYLFRAAAVFLTLHPLWTLRVIGAGDIKLCCIMGAWMGISAFAGCFFCSLISGGAMAFLHMVRYRIIFQRFSYFLAWFRQCISKKQWIVYLKPEEADKRNTIPFSAALTLGYILWMMIA